MSGYAKIINSSNNDEELLIIPSAAELRKHEKLQQYEKAPKCCCIFNTSCGSYFIAALQVTYGLINLIGCMNFMADPTLESATDQAGTSGLNLNINENQMYQYINATSLKLYFVTLISLFSITSGFLTFKGLNHKNERFFRPAILFYVSSIIVGMMQLCYIVYSWDDLSVSLRKLLQVYNQTVENELTDDIETEKELGIDTSLDSESLSVWKEIEFMVNDDTTWFAYTKGYLLTMVSGFIMVNILTFCWFAWVLTTQAYYIKSKRMVESMSV